MKHWSLIVVTVRSVTRPGRSYMPNDPTPLEDRVVDGLDVEAAVESAAGDGDRRAPAVRGDVEADADGRDRGRIRLSKRGPLVEVDDPRHGAVEVGPVPLTAVLNPERGRVEGAR